MTAGTFPKVVRVSLTSAGSGYTERDLASLRVEIEPPRDEWGVPLTDGRQAEASVALDQLVAALVIDDAGSGYARGQPLSLRIESPAACGGEADGEGARGSASLGPTTDFSGMSSSGPFGSLYPEGSSSSKLLRLLPSTTRPIRLPNGAFALAFDAQTVTARSPRFT